LADIDKSRKNPRRKLYSSNEELDKWSSNSEGEETRTEEIAASKEKKCRKTASQESAVSLAQYVDDTDTADTSTFMTVTFNEVRPEMSRDEQARFLFLASVSSDEGECFRI
jgi:hypothetical protein